MPSDPTRGEIWWADLGIAAKYRPVFMVSGSFGDADYALPTVIPHTTSPRGASFEVDVKVPGLKPGAFHVQCLFAVPPKVFERRVGQLSDEQIQKVDETIRKWLKV
ncbi:MAG: transcriptional modulator of MazE/toxin MazF [Verrucomicrobiales bacterium]|nr:transcriptional modulator of MazE/toxin MazF [Verrucomicrobiales bacterium]|tara:strand:- start:12334 stop:12651 length:318 start_codon:yes stop_codon:yes gene_type:complete